jgi:hypothetical protein
MSTIPTVLHTQNEYGMHIFLPLKGRNAFLDCDFSTLIENGNNFEFSV